MFRTANPALNANVFSQARAFGAQGTMSVQGTVNKCFVLLFLVLLSASWIWGKVMQPADALEWGQQAARSVPAAVGMWMMVGIIGGFITALVTVFKAQWAAVTAPVYALFEGLALGGISAFFEVQYPGLVIQAVALTFGTLFALLTAYKSGMIKVTQKFRLGVVAATGGIALVYFISWIVSFFSPAGMYLFSVQNAGVFGIGLSLFVVVIAALNLVLDFDFIERGAAMGAPRHMEWYGAFGLMVTLIWLYIEILRLLARLRQRR